MPTQVQFRRGTTAQNQSFTGAAGELSIDTDKKTVVVHDGSTPGGNPLAPNTAFDVANAAFNSANNVAPQVAPAFNTANAAFDKANNALANTSNVVFAGDLRVTGNVFIGSNTVTITNNSITATSITATNLVVNGSSVPSGAVSNLAFDTANAAFASSNTVGGYANTVGGYANTAGSLANQAGVIANASFGVVNAAFGLTNSTYAAVNSAFGVINAAFGVANNAYTSTNGAAAFAFANGVSTNTTAAFGLTNSTYTAVNSAFAVINAAYGQANTLKTSANAYADLVGTSANNYAGSMANASNTYAASLTPNLAPPFNVANAAFDKANSANVLAYNTGIGANAYATAVGTAGNTYAATVGTNANNYANATFLKLTGGTVSGDLSVTGNLNITGNTAFINVTNYKVQDSLIYLADTNYATDVVEIGFVGNYNNGACTTVHTGLFRAPSNKQYYLFQGYDKEPANNYIDPTGNNITNAVLVADLITSNLNLGGANAITWITSGFGVANAAYGQANTLATSANAYAAAVGVSANAYAVTVGTSGNAFATAIGTAGNAYAVTVGTSGNNYAATVGTSSNNYAGVMANSVNTYTSATYSTLTQFGSVFGVANGAFDKANAAATAASPTFTGTVNVNANTAFQTLTDGVTISWDVSLGQIATVTLAGNRTVAAPTNLKVGTYILHVIQDATGSRTLTWNSVFKWPAATAPTLTTTANARDVFSFICDGTNLYGTYVPDVR